jgi:hypothetical protein
MIKGFAFSYRTKDDPIRPINDKEGIFLTVLSNIVNVTAQGFIYYKIGM